MGGVTTPREATDECDTWRALVGDRSPSSQHTNPKCLGYRLSGNSPRRNRNNASNCYEISAPHHPSSLMRRLDAFMGIPTTAAPQRQGSGHIRADLPASAA